MIVYLLKESLPHLRCLIPISDLTILILADLSLTERIYDQANLRAKCYAPQMSIFS